MESLPPKPKKNKTHSREELLNIDKNDLVDKILQLEAHNVQLRNIISKHNSAETDSEDSDLVSKKEFDFSKCHYRRILLRVMYFGWDYQGLAVQEDSNQTIEHHLFHALTKCYLIQSRETSQYHRCGRTDKGVSSFGQVISISLRSKFPLNDQYEPLSIKNEIPYCKILNRLLTKDIRVVAWMPIPEDKPDYSSRFDCKKRKYKYYFPRSNLDVAAMKTACGYLVGSHDYRHLCKMDVANGVTKFRRDVLSADIVPVDAEGNQPMTMYCLIIEGNAFLWHQIRCIMGVLLLVGQGNEAPEVVKELLDVEKNPRKPQYNMALHVPLNLFHCSYDLEETQQWVYDVDELKTIIRHLQTSWTIQNIKSTMIKDSIEQLEAEFNRLSESETQNGCERESVVCYTDCLIQGVKPRNYTPLLKRVTCSSLEERIEHYKKKRKMEEKLESTQQDSKMEE